MSQMRIRVWSQVWEWIVGFLIFGILLSLHAAGGSSIRCYQCTSLEDPSCATERPHESFLLSCDSPDPNSSSEEAFDELFDAYGTKKETDTDAQEIKSEKYEHDGGGDLDKNYTMCRKTVVSIYDNSYYWSHLSDNETSKMDFATKSGWSTRTVRQCGYVSDSKYDNVCVSKSVPNIRQTMCACTGDACNGVGRTRLKLWSWSSHLLLVVVALGSVVRTLEFIHCMPGEW